MADTQNHDRPPTKKPLPRWILLEITMVALIIIIGLLDRFYLPSVGPVAAPAIAAAAATPAAAEPAASPTLQPTPTSQPTAEADIPPDCSATPTLQPMRISKPVLRVSSKDRMVMVHVPAGPFLMGSSPCIDPDSQPEQQPAHTVNLDSYWIDRTEVTNALYARCVKTDACSAPHDASSATRQVYYGNPKFANFPVINVDWSQASAYCQWAGRRLPSEAEWEKAARGTDGRIIPWSASDGSVDDKTNTGNFLNRVRDTTRVGSYPKGASPYGALDMAGNVWEWVQDWYSETYYQDSPTNNPTGPLSAPYRGLRGGSWISDFIFIEERAGAAPQGWFNTVGFRCAVSP
ncbi:MAG: SUMF1/EgtB/PvdO family nonheme iron enzyme [Anaerolineaceae bacterium]|nr:SUMF1/EgtB/PvdO family nonheme iron enzyme [Anaerolineaceae bacterium]